MNNDDFGLVDGNDIRKESEELIGLLARGLMKRYKKRQQIPVVIVTVLAALLDEAKETMERTGYGVDAIEAWVDWGERWGTAIRNGRDFSEGDIQALQKAFKMYPKAAEKMDGFIPPTVASE